MSANTSTVDGRQTFGGRDRAIEQLVRFHQLVDEPQPERVGWLVRAGPQHDRLEVLGSGRESHDLERNRRERDSDLKLWNSNPRGAVHHQSLVSRSDEQAASGNRVPVGRGDYRSGVHEDALERAAHCRHERFDVIPAAFQDTKQIDAGGEDPARSRKDDGSGVVRVVECLDDGIAQFQVEGVCLAVLDTQHGDAVTIFAVNHRRIRSWRS